MWKTRTGYRSTSSARVRDPGTSERAIRRPSGGAPHHCRGRAFDGGLRLDADDGAHPGCQARHLAQGEADSALRARLMVPAIELAACGHRAHFVVDLGPADLPAAMAVPDEGDDVGWWDLGSCAFVEGSRGGRGRPLGHGLTGLP